MIHYININFGAYLKIFKDWLPDKELHAAIYVYAFVQNVTYNAQPLLVET